MDETKQWIQQVTKKYSMQLKPLDFKQTASKGELTVEVTGNFPGSPAVMQYNPGFEGTSIHSSKISG